MLTQVQGTRSSRSTTPVAAVSGLALEQPAMSDTALRLAVVAVEDDREQQARVPATLLLARARVDGLNVGDDHDPEVARDLEVRAFAAGLATAGGVVDQTTRDDFGALVSRLRINGTRDVNDLVQQVLRESYLSSTQDLNFYAQKVAFYNDLKKKIRNDITGLRKALSDNAGTPEAQAGAQPIKYPLDAIDTDRFIVKADGTQVPNPNFGLPRYPGATEAVSRWASIPEVDEEGRLVAVRENKSTLGLAPTKEELSNYIEDLEQLLNSVGDDAQLANVDLQNMLQKQQQTLQMMSNISKVLHDTAMAIVRKISG